MYTPRHLRRKGNASRNGSRDSTKTMAFRAAAALSKRFIHQKASQLVKPALAAEYSKWCVRADNGTLRKG